MIQKRKPKASRSSLIRHDLSGFLIQGVAAIYKLTRDAVAAWDCPREKGGTLNLGDVVPWRDAQMKQKPSGKTDLETEKLRLQCQKLEMDITRMQSEMITLETHKQIMTSRALSLKNFLFELSDKNANLLCQKSVEQVRPQLREMMTAALNHYSSNHK